MSFTENKKDPQTTPDCEKTACPLPPPIPQTSTSPEPSKNQKARGDAAEGKDDPNTQNDGDNGPGSD